MKRMAVPRRVWLAYSARKVPASTPIGVPSAIASALITALPKKALSRPPRSSGGGVIMVNRSGPKLAMPLLTVTHRIQTSQNRPKTAAATANSMASRSLSLRLKYRRSVAFISGPAGAAAAAA